MTDLREVLPWERGARPWRPSAALEPGAVLDHWDVPRVGLLRGPGTTYVFAALDDGAPRSMWAYAELGVAELRALLALHGVEAFGQRLGAFYAQRPVTVATAVDLRLVAAATVPPGPGAPAALAKRYRRRLTELREGIDAALA